MGKEDRKMKQLFEKNKSKNNGTSVRIVDVPVNPKNLDTKVITFDPTKERASKFWTVRQAIQEMEGPAQPTPGETSPEGEQGEADLMDDTNGVTVGEISMDLSEMAVGLQKEGSVTTGCLVG